MAAYEPDDFEDALALAAALRRRELSVLEVLEGTLQRIGERNGDLGAIVWLSEEDARARARRAQERLDADDPAPMLGVPLPVKDLHAVEGWPLTYGSWGGPHAPSTRSSLAVMAIENAGFVLVGKTNTPELGELPATEGARLGPARNPWDLTRTAGGSSGGAASAVAGGMVPIAHGSDGGGSIRIPAACCGLVGLKPTRGRVPARFAPWFGLSTEGVLTRSVRDQAAVLGTFASVRGETWLALLGPVDFGTAPQSRGGVLRVGLVTDAPFGLPVDEARANAAREVVAHLAELGHEVVETAIELPEGLVEAVVTLLAAALAEHDDIDWSRVEPHTAADWQRAQSMTAIELVHARTTLERAGAALNARLPGGADVLVCPTVAIPPPPVGSILAAAHAAAGTGAPALEVLAMAVFTVPWNVAGVPAISLPTHLDVDGLPIGVRLVGTLGSESTLLELAGQLEEVFRWPVRRPTTWPRER